MAVQSADTVTVNATLVDVHAIVVGPVRVSGRTETVVSALPILADLALGALVCTVAAFVHVDAVMPGYGIQGVTGSADQPGRAPATFSSCSIHGLLNTRVA